MTDVQTSDPVADQIIKALQDVIDPELGIDLVNLGLIYGVDMTAEGVVTVRMTLTMSLFALHVIRIR